MISFSFFQRVLVVSTKHGSQIRASKGQIIPVEVKSGPTGRMKSLYMFIDKHQSKMALKISQATFQKGNPVISIPFYAIESFLQRKEL